MACEVLPRKFGKFARANGNGQTLSSAGLNRHAAFGVARAQGVHPGVVHHAAQVVQHGCIPPGDGPGLRAENEDLELDPALDRERQTD